MQRMLAVPPRGAVPARGALPGALFMLASLAGCTAFDPKIGVLEPTTASPAARPAPSAQATNGAIYQAVSYRPLFEDRRARHVGDTLTVLINEKLSASQKAATSTSRSGSVSVDVPTIKGFPGKTFQGAGVDAQGDNKFSGKGETTDDNVFTGNITATVVEVLANGNLVVAGEKRIGVNRNSSTLRFSGVVNPAAISGANTVSSTQVADARLDYKGSGTIDEAQVMGWLARFFLTVMPF